MVKLMLYLRRLYTKCHLPIRIRKEETQGPGPVWTKQKNILEGTYQVSQKVKYVHPIPYQEGPFHESTWCVGL